MPPSAKRKRLVFVSHSARDTWVAGQIAQEIARCGAKAFLDEADIAVGAAFEEEILDNLNAADELVVLMSPWALNRPYIWAELGAAWCRKIPIVVVLQGITPEELQSHPDVPLFVKKRNLVEINAIDDYFAELRKRVGK